MTDPVVLDEARHDREQGQAKRDRDEARNRAQMEYDLGELDDWISDECDPADTFKLAHELVNWLDDIDLVAKQSGGELQAAVRILTLVNELREHLDPLAVRDFRATIEAVIEKRAAIILE